MLPSKWPRPWGNLSERSPALTTGRMHEDVIITKGGGLKSTETRSFQYHHIIHTSCGENARGLGLEICTMSLVDTVKALNYIRVTVGHETALSGRSQ